MKLLNVTSFHIWSFVVKPKYNAQSENLRALTQALHAAEHNI